MPNFYVDDTGYDINSDAYSLHLYAVRIFDFKIVWMSCVRRRLVRRQVLAARPVVRSAAPCVRASRANRSRRKRRLCSARDRYCVPLLIIISFTLFVRFEWIDRGGLLEIVERPITISAWQVRYTFHRILLDVVYVMRTPSDTHRDIHKHIRKRPLCPKTAVIIRR